MSFNKKAQADRLNWTQSSVCLETERKQRIVRLLARMLLKKTLAERQARSAA